ncbi:MAG: tyrosine-type recombinase/integrase [Methylotenera sp.]|nr:tyrosine-type recombinase/integrase [Methylotenera sp.]MDP1959671.1 tyrosine-type recombinase/integrase [Methylotenera sp.]MDP3943267.1 tyrosine-type recombinase/integrase [Methylotenera sp.]
MGVQTPHSLHFDNWKAQLTISPRTVVQYTKDVQLFIKQFPSIEDVTKKEVSLWMDKLTAKGDTRGIQHRIIKACRNYWKFLARYHIQGMVEAPFHQVILADKGKKKPPREPFKPHEIVELWTIARANDDYVLADLIAMGAYTGARVEELCSLLIKDVGDDVFNIIDAKTLAGVRSVPIHSHIKAIIKRLKENAEEDYLIPTLSFDRFNKRAGALIGRFSKMKTKAGYGATKTLHSLRHSFITSLSNASVLEFHIADIVGHEKKGITGKYTKGIDDDVKRVAIEKVSYSFPELT